MIYLPWELRTSTKCERCFLRYADTEGYCYHCHGLTDNQIEQLKEIVRNEHRAHREIGYGMLFLFSLALIVVVGVVALVLIGT